MNSPPEITRTVAYPVRLEPDADDGGFVVHVRGFGATQGDNEAHALWRTTHFISTWLDLLAEEGKAIPAPNPPEPGEVMVTATLDDPYS